MNRSEIEDHPVIFEFRGTAARSPLSQKGLPYNMTTPARAAANAANAQLSTGPRTEAGKARSARNALKHGLTSRDLIVREDEKEEFDQFQQDLQAEYRPEGTAEMFAFNQIIDPTT